MTLEIIGAGFGRTGTHSLKLALQHLGFFKCYHMEDLIENPDNIHYWEDARDRKPVNWPELFKGYRAVVDFPANMHYQDFLQAYPEAKVILTTRDPESWYQSFGNTIVRQSRPPLKQIIAMSFSLPFNKKFRKQIRVFKYANQYLDDMFGGQFYEDKEKAITFFKDWNARVEQTVPADRLLKYEVKQGWQPLCNFLSCPVPNEPFPRSNTTAEFNAKTRTL